MSARPLPSQAELQARFWYNPDNGLCVWKPLPIPHDATALERQRIDLWNKRFAGKTVGSNCTKRNASFGNVRFLLHRLIWKWMTGEDPDEIDHKNGDQSDNRWANLRNVDRPTNNKNCALRSDNRSGCAGVYYSGERKAWRVWVEKTYVGQFKVLDDAVAARRAAQAERGFTDRHGRAA